MLKKVVTHFFSEPLITISNKGGAWTFYPSLSQHGTKVIENSLG